MASNRRIALIVEDQPFVGMVASDILRESGFDTFHAFDSPGAAEQLDAHPEIELMIVDAGVDGGAGAALAFRLAESRPDLHLLVAAERGREPAGLPSSVRILSKPFASGELRLLAGDRELA